MENWNQVEEPSTVDIDSPTSEKKTIHPAFGQIAVSRIQGHANLYGSDFTHNNFISIRVSKSELYRGLSKDWPYARDEIVEVRLSEAQWATFVSSFNRGDGVQCTLRHINREPIPLLPSPKPRIDEFKGEARKTIGQANQELNDLRKQISELKLAKKQKEELVSKLNRIESAIGSSVDFVLKQFGEHMENTVEKAKIEVEAYINNRITEAGLEVLKNESSILYLEQEK